ncbi:hypothetical protein EJ04DRAFT_514992 [Polyplosphaeria fusca]|uniref:Uncharacterized protein n=1 Tax=Polyplosphaeria fusca TaxID=682080 RepID=A0A9P4QQT1_9PLEO|nr:hypothetical protein EJ04DRAFT_514992 [Polyplosphaeria fusca]
MFTNFKFTTHISLPTNYDPSQTPAHQIHTIDVAGPLNLLTCTITATSNTSTSAITSLAISRLPPWTSRDLSPFTALRARENDLSTLCWSLTSYWSLAHRRAQFWHACESAFAHLLPGRTASDTENATPKTDKRAARPPPPLSRKDLHRHLGRDVLVLEDAHVLLKVSWRIGFDWTGEAESEVGVEPAFPAVCKCLVC